MAKFPLSIYLLRHDRVAEFEQDLHVNVQTALPLAPPLDGYVLPLPVKQTVPNGSVLSTLCSKIRPHFLSQDRLLPPLWSFAAAQGPSF